MASSKKPVYKVEMKPISEKKRRSSDLVIMWQSILDLSLCVLDKCWAISNHIWDATKVWIKGDDQREIMTWLEKHLSTVPRDFTYSWRDGMILSVLLNKLRPGCFPDAENLDPEYGLRNMYRALNVLEARFRIVPKVTAEEIVTCCNGSTQKLQDLLFQLKQETDKHPQSSPECEEGTQERQPTLSSSDTCIAKGPGLQVGVVGRETNFVVNYNTSLTELDLVVEIKGPTNELCSERVTKRSPKRKKSVRNWKPSPPCLERSHSEKNKGIMAEETGDSIKYRHIPLKYEIRSNQVHFAYTPFTKGRHKVSILHRGQHISDSPYSVSVELEVGSGIRSMSAKIEEETPKKVRFQEPKDSKRSFGKVVKRRVLRYIVKIDKKDIVVDTDSIEQLAPALLKMDYELQKRPLIRRNSWGFVGDAERKVSMIRQFCVDADELEAQCLKMRRSNSLTLSTKPKKVFPKNFSYECEDIPCRSKLETVTEGKGFKESPHLDQGLAYLNEEFECDVPAEDETIHCDDDTTSQLGGDDIYNQPTSLPFSWPSQSESSLQRTHDEKVEIDQTQLGAIKPHRGSESSDCDSQLNRPSNFLFAQTTLKNDLNAEESQVLCELEDAQRNYHPERFCTDIEEPFTKTNVKRLGNGFHSKENEPITLTPKLKNYEINREYPENVQSFNFSTQNPTVGNVTCNNQKRTSTLKNRDSGQVFIPPYCVSRRQRCCYYKNYKHRNNYKNSVINPLNVIYFPVCKDHFYKRYSKNSVTKLEKGLRNNCSNTLRNSNVGQSLSNENQNLYSTPKQTFIAKPENKYYDVSSTNVNFYPKSRDAPNISDSSVTKQLLGSNLKPLNTNKYETHKTGSNISKFNASFYLRNKLEPHHTPTNPQLKPKESLKEYSLKKQPLVPLGQLHYKHFNPVIENKKDGPVKLLVKQWQKQVCDEPHKMKRIQKLDTLPEKGNLTAKLSFWESVRKKNTEPSPSITSAAEFQQKGEENNKNRNDIADNSTSNILNITETLPELSPSTSKENSHPSNLTGKPNDNMTTIKNLTSIPLSTPRKRSFSDPGGTTFFSSEVSDFTETLPEPIIENHSLSSDANYLELSADDELSSVDLLYSTEDEYIDDEISDTASTYWGDLSFIKDLKLADATAYREFCSLVDSKYLRDRIEDSCPFECRVYGIANYFGHVAVKNRFRVLTNGSGCGNLSATVQGLGHHEVPFVSVEYVQKDVYEVTYQVLNPGLYLIAVRWMETPIPGSPFLCKVTF